jgi:hypothetical protein
MKKYLVLIFLSFPFFAFCPTTQFSAIVDTIRQTCKVEKIETKWVMALFLSEDVHLENKTRYCKKNRTWYYGPGEICFATAKEVGYMGTRTDLKDYRVNIPLAIKYIKALYYRHRNWKQAIQAYKTGSGAGEIYFLRVKEIYDKTF